MDIEETVELEPPFFEPRQQDIEPTRCGKVEATFAATGLDEGVVDRALIPDDRMHEQVLPGVVEVVT